MIYALVAVLFLAGVGWAGAALGASPLFLVAIPYAALAVFLFGFFSRIIGWAASPVPFCIPTTCGQQRSLSVDQTG